MPGSETEFTCPSLNTVQTSGTHTSKNILINWKWHNVEQPDLWRTFRFDTANRLFPYLRWCLILDGNPCSLVDSTADWPWCTRSQMDWLKFHRNTILYHVCRTQQEVIPDNSSISKLRLTHLRTIPAWNALPQAVAEADSLDIFKRHMGRHLQFWPSASCTTYIVCTCSTAHSFFPGFNLRTYSRRCWSPWPRSR